MNGMLYVSAPLLTDLIVIHSWRLVVVVVVIVIIIMFMKG